ncbi:MAG TPA: lamin tail domain-containing protein [Polyangia bacterium]|jgi:hypothetical protein
MSRFVALVLACTLSAGAGCASAENALPGDDRDLSAPAGDDGGGDLSIGRPSDMLPGDGGVALPTCAAGKHIVVNEVKTGGTASADDEFVELYNPCAIDIDLAGSTLVHRSATGTTETLIITLNETIISGGYLLVAGLNYTGSGTPDQTYGGAGDFAQAGGGVGLRDTTGALIDSMGYGSGTTNALVEGAPAAAPASGQSIARTPNGADSNHNDADFAVATTPTPRAAN